MTFARSIITSERSQSFIILAVCLLFAVVVLSNGWLYEDAYITFRVVDNFINGYGLTWNPAERVQAYTHPLWLFLLSASYFFTREIFYTSLLLSVVVSLLAILVFAFGLAKSSTTALLGVAIFTCSKAFVDYSTSGLENPLTHLLLALFLFVYLKFELTLKRLFLLAFIAALGLVNRMDTLLLFGPVLVYGWWQLRSWRGLAVVLAGFLPFILWEGFALFYYGFPFPNTAYAKLHTGVNSLALAKGGLYYLLRSLQLDPLTLPFIIAGLALPLITKERQHLPLTIGIALYLLYIIKIGGDYMNGRFLTAPLFVAVVLLLDSRLARLKPTGGLLFSVVLLAGLSSPYSPLLYANYSQEQETPDMAHKVADSRAGAYPHAGFLQAIQNPDLTWPNHSWVTEGQTARANGPAVIVRGPIGFFGFYAGPQVHIVDKYALAEPFLARLPPKIDLTWQAGHFKRRVPEGYLETLSSGQNQIKDKDLATYYDKLALVTRGDLFDLNRFVEIWKLNTGVYDALVLDYPPLFRVDLGRLDLTTMKEAFWNEADNLAAYAGIQLDLGKEYYADQAEISLAYLNNGQINNSDRDYQLIYYKEALPIAEQILLLPSQIPPGGQVSIIQIAAEASAAGYDQIKIFPGQDDNFDTSVYVIQQIKLLE